MKKSEISKVMSEMGRRGAKVRYSRMTKAERIALGKKAAGIRWRAEKKLVESS